MPGVPGLMAFSKPPPTSRDLSRAAVFAKGSKTEVFVRASPRSQAAPAPLTRRATCAALPSNSTPTEGNWDLVGNNIPVFFIQDAIKFPDLIHSVKMEADKGYPQAASAHDTFWDFIGLMPEATHMIMWAMCDRTIPRSLRMMEGFGVHTFRLVNDGRRQQLRQIPLEADARPSIDLLGRSRQDCRRRPGLPPPRPLRGDRSGAFPAMGSWRSSNSTKNLPRRNPTTCSIRPS